MSAVRHELTLMIAPESLAYGTFVVDDTHRIVSWNDIATRTLGYDAEATLGHTCEEVLALLRVEDVSFCPCIATTPTPFAPETCNSSSHIQHTDSPARLRQESEPARLRVITRHGVARWLSISVLRARTLDGTACVLHLLRDITEHTEQDGRRDAAAQVARHPGTVLRLPVAKPEVDEPAGDHELAIPERLTPREHEVLALLAQGMATVEIAAALGISRVTARNHVTRVIEKLCVKTRLQAVLAASRLGLI
ncbi:MAG: LuxR C-terminal-related transcriptional regulator [Nitrososphaerota archaeon]